MSGEKAAVYVRLSEEDRDKEKNFQESRSIINQKSLLFTYAEENGFDFTEVEPEYTPGDVDASGNVDIADLRMVLRAVCEKTTLTADQKLAADVEKDNTVDIQDLRKLLRFVCGKIEEL